MSSGAAARLAAQIDDLLPQTQCTRCGFPGCEPYAAAIAAGTVEINQCPPGGQATVQALAQLLQRPELELNPDHGVAAPRRVAWIDESRCIGCARCLAPCPMDAIIGAPKYMHTVLIDACTGCELCLPPCPVDCIELRAPPAAHENRPALNRSRFAAHAARAAARDAARRTELETKKAAAVNPAAP